MPRPTSFQTLRPRAPASRERRRLSTRTPASKPGRLDRAQVDVAEREEAPGVRAVVAIEVALELVAPEAVEVDDRLDAGLVERRDQLADVGDRPGPLGAAHEIGRVEPQPVVPQPEPAPEVVVGVDGGDERQRDVRLREHEPRLRQPVSERAGHSLMQAARWPLAGSSCGSTGRQASSPIGQRGWKRQPAGMSTGFGVSPCRICGLVPVVRVAPRHDRDQRLACTGAAGCRPRCAPGPPRRCARGT